MEIRITTAEEGEVRNEEGEEIHYATFSAQQSTNLTANGIRGSFSRSLFGSVCVSVDGQIDGVKLLSPITAT